MSDTITARVDRIKEWRDAEGWSNEGLADAMGVHYITVNRVLVQGWPARWAFLDGIVQAWGLGALLELFEERGSREVAA